MKGWTFLTGMVIGSILCVGLGFTWGAIETERRMADENAFKVTTLDAPAGAKKSRFRVTGEEDPARAVFENVDVGVGVTSPTEDLEVAGAVKVGNATGTADGTVRWTGSDFEGRKGGAWTSLTGGGTNGWHLLETVTASDDATVEFTSNIDSSYQKYAIVVTSGVPSINDGEEFYMRFSTDGGVTWEDDVGDYAWVLHNVGTGFHNTSSDDSDDEIEMFQAVGGDTNETGVNCVVMICDPSDTSLWTTAHWTGTRARSNGKPQTGDGAGTFESTSAVDGIQFLFSSGNIESGKFKLYGIR